MTTEAEIPVGDVWLRIPFGEEEAEAEANTFVSDACYQVQWCLTAVGLVKRSPWFGSLALAHRWLENAGFEDYSS